MGPDLIRVVVVEDHPLFAQVLCGIIGETPGLELTAAADSVESPALAGLTADQVDVVLLDLRLRGLSDAPAVALLVLRGHRVLVLSGDEAPETVARAVGAGARGYLTKHSEAPEILRAIREVADGGTHVTPRHLTPVLAAHLLGEGSPVHLTERECEILELLAEGDTDRQIAGRLGIRISTVQSHLDRIRDKTGARRRAELTRLAAGYGVLPPSQWFRRP